MLRRFQFSLRTLMVVATLAGLALAFPAFAIIAPFGIALLLLCLILVIVFAIIQICVFENERYVWKWAIDNVLDLLVGIAVLVLYLIYGLYTVDFTM